MRENFLKNISGGAAISSAIQPAPAEEKTIPAEIPQTDDTAELLRQILAETKKTNELLTKLLNR